MPTGLLETTSLVLQSNGGSALGGIFLLLYFGFIFGLVAVTIAGLWKTFEKAGEPGWGAIVPIYNTYLVLKIAGRPGWWLLLFFIPFVNIYVMFRMYYDFALSFGRGVGYMLGLLFLSVVFFPLLGFGDAEYQGPAAA